MSDNFIWALNKSPIKRHNEDAKHLDEVWGHRLDQALVAATSAEDDAENEYRNGLVNATPNKMKTLGRWLDEARAFKSAVEKALHLDAIDAEEETR